MNENRRLFDELFFLIRRERKIKNTTQVVEFISVFIYLKYLKINMLEDNGDFQFDCSDKRSFVSICHHIVSCGFYGDFSQSNSKIKDILINSIDNFMLNVDNNHLLFCLSEFLNRFDDIYYLKELREPYNDLIEKMVLESSQSGEFYTPKAISEVVIAYLKPSCSDIIYDPACGTSGLLVETAKYLESSDYFNYQQLTIYGNDISFFAFIVSNVNLILNSKVESCIRLGDSLEMLNYNRGNYSVSQLYDVVLTNPPFGKNNISNIYGLDQEQFIDYQFLRLVMCSLKTDGRAAVILPERFVYDSSSQSKMLKKELFNSFSIDCILSLPPGVMLPYTGVKLVIVFFSRTTPSGKVWLYKLNNKEKLTKNKKLEFCDFDDFFKKAKFKEESENSWYIDINELDLSYNVFEKAESKAVYSDFTLFSKPLDEINSVGIEIRNTIDSIDKKVKYIKSSVTATVEKYQFYKVKVGELITSVKTVPLSKEKLLNEGAYPVYGGNGIIGYYDDYINSGKFILVGRVGALCGNVHYVEGDIWVTNNSIVLECSDLARVYPAYLARLLSNKDLRGLASGTAQPHLTVTKVKNMDVKLPSIEVQIKLEELLSQLDKELALQNKLVKQLSRKGESLKKELNGHLLQI
ncbi:N-6 DNA methylase [Aliivibrio salmonicida]|uniref:N-6 DNA methylase n=1 Tax=Aliivibrio salmonicida TaxID=40269 RepID=UPI00406C85AF